MTIERKNWITGGVVLALIAIGAFVFLRPHAAEPASGEAAAAPPARVVGNTLRFPEGAPQLAYLRIEPVASYAVPLLEPLNGRIAYDENRTARIFSPTGGRVLKVLAQAGDLVKADQPLLLLDVPDYADLRKAESDRRTKASAFERARQLFEHEVIARKDFEDAENDFQASDAELERARARLRILRPLPGQPGFALRTPLAGIVTERQASPAMEVRPDQSDPLFVVSDPSVLWAIAELPEKDLAKVRVGQHVAIEVDAYPGRQFAGRIVAIGDVLDPQSRRVPVRCEVRNAERALKPEMFARVTPELDGQRLPRIANTAIVTEGVNDYVFVEKEKGLIEKRRVQLAFRGHETSFVSEGLQVDERVVTVGALLLNAELSGT